MIDTDRPNRKSNMEKAEGDRPPEPEDQGEAGITNRSVDEEQRNQELPDRGRTKTTPNTKI